MPFAPQLDHATTGPNPNRNWPFILTPLRHSTRFILWYDAPRHLLLEHAKQIGVP
jgi:hypothetical protein